MTVTPLDCARAAIAAYNEPPTFTAAGVEVLRVEMRRAVIYSHRGTDDLPDILADLKGWSIDDPDLGKCHAGFIGRAEHSDHAASGVRAVWPEYGKYLDDDTSAGRWVYFTGHSKGGAGASLIAALAVVYGYHVAGLVTLGSPRPGHARLAEILKPVPQRRYKRGNDFVTTKPWALWGYRHICPVTEIADIWQRYTAHTSTTYLIDLEALDRAGDSRAAWPTPDRSSSRR